MVATDPAAMIFQDAHEVHDSALQKLSEGDIRDAAEKAWCATKRATDALILALTGEEPPTTAIDYRGASTGSGQEGQPTSRHLVGRYLHPYQLFARRRVSIMGCAGQAILSAVYGRPPITFRTLRI